MTDYNYTEDRSSPFIAAIKQSYRKSLARVHQATLSLHTRQSHIGARSYSEKLCRAVKHIKIFAIFTAGLFVAMVMRITCVYACIVYVCNSASAEHDCTSTPLPET